MPVAVYGKHPAKGDFLEAGMPPALLSTLESWLDGALGQVRETLGSQWPSTWAAAPMLRFWLGEGIWGGPVAGVIAPSQDRVGRRFPLVLLVAGTDAPPPPIVPLATDAADWHDLACAHLAACLERTAFDRPAALLENAPQPETPEGIGGIESADFWAVQPGTDPRALWAEVAATDHRRAAAGRSYWWVAGEEKPVAPQHASEEAVEPEETPEPGESLAMEMPTEAEVAEEPAQSTEWDVPKIDDDAANDSPFDAPETGFGLFAAPQAAFAGSDADPFPAQSLSAPAHVLRAPLWSQVLACNGLPSGEVLAWFLRGHVGND